MSGTSVPFQQKQRLELVDSLRGFALSALFLVHVMEAYELYWAQPDPDWSSRLVFMLFMGKSFPLMSIGFGFSCYMLIDRPGRDPGHNALWFIWRLAILEVIGCLHGLLYSGDIIEIFATLGFPLLVAARCRDGRVLAGIALICFLQPMQLWELASAWREGAVGMHALAAAASSAEVAAYLHGSLLDVLRVNMWAGQFGKWQFMIETGRIFQIFGLYLVGLMLGRMRFFARLDELQRGRRLALGVCLILALSLHVSRGPVLHWFVDDGVGVKAVQICQLLLEGWEDLAFTTCWGLAICALWQGRARRVLTPLAAVGRATLSLYILQSLVFIPLFYPFGANLFHAWHGPQRLLSGMVAIGIQTGAANLWFQRFRYGPIEWAWRAATDMRVDIPFRHAKAAMPNRNRDFDVVGMSNCPLDAGGRFPWGLCLRVTRFLQSRIRKLKLIWK